MMPQQVRGANTMPTTPTTAGRRRRTRCSAPPPSRRPSGSFSPMRRETSAVAPMPSPIADRIQDGEDRLGEPDHRNGVGAEARHPEDVDDREHRLHRHLEHHRDREQEHRSAHAALRVVVLLARQGFAHDVHGSPPAARGACVDGFSVHSPASKRGVESAVDKIGSTAENGRCGDAVRRRGGVLRNPPAGSRRPGAAF